MKKQDIHYPVGIKVILPLAIIFLLAMGLSNWFFSNRLSEQIHEDVIKLSQKTQESTLVIQEIIKKLQKNSSLAEEQSIITRNIYENIQQIHDHATYSREKAKETSQSSHQLSDLAQMLEKLVEKFKV